MGVFSTLWTGHAWVPLRTFPGHPAQVWSSISLVSKGQMGTAERMRRQVQPLSNLHRDRGSWGQVCNCRSIVNHFELVPSYVTTSFQMEWVTNTYNRCYYVYKQQLSWISNILIGQKWMYFPRYSFKYILVLCVIISILPTLCWLTLLLGVSSFFSFSKDPVRAWRWRQLEGEEADRKQVETTVFFPSDVPAWLLGLQPPTQGLVTQRPHIPCPTPHLSWYLIWYLITHVWKFEIRRWIIINQD